MLLQCRPLQGPSPVGDGVPGCSSGEGREERRRGGEKRNKEERRRGEKRREGGGVGGEREAGGIHSQLHM